jgi:hypothetical protein
MYLKRLKFFGYRVEKPEIDLDLYRFVNLGTKPFFDHITSQNTSRLKSLIRT